MRLPIGLGNVTVMRHHLRVPMPEPFSDVGFGNAVPETMRAEFQRPNTTSALRIRPGRLQTKQIDRTVAIDGDDMPAVSGWRWGAKEPAKTRGTSTEGDNV